MSTKFSCADCAAKFCQDHMLDKLPPDCPTKTVGAEAFKAMYTDEDMNMAHMAALTECDGYGVHTRLEDTMGFAHRMGYKKLGIGFCTGFSREAATLIKILRSNGFDVESACCKCGSVKKEFIDIDQQHQINKNRDFEIMCNPAGQAEYLASQGVELAIILGLCVGHDTLFIKHASMPVTVLVAKDRAMGHNPVGALYTADSYKQYLYSFIKDNFPEE